MAERLDELLQDFELDGDEDGWLDSMREAERPIALGTVGEFELIEEVGRGGQGVVYRARRVGGESEGGAGGVVAVKRLIAGAFAGAAERRRLERELAATESLEHPSIVKVHALALHEGEPLLSMEWIDGTPVDAWVRARRAERPPRAVIELFLAICDAVEHAHRSGVIHRDLKPSNVLVDDGGRPHLVDFGLARRLTPPAGDERLTLSAHVLGTPSYSAPEQFRAGTSVDARADVYSLGVILFELLTGELPHEVPAHPSEWLRALDSREPRRASAVRPALGPELDTILLMATATEPERRYPTVEALASDLRRFLAGDPILAHPPSALYQLRKLARRHAWPFVLTATVLVLVLGFGVWSAVQARRLRDQREAARGEAARAQQLLDFFLGDVLASADPLSTNPPTLEDALVHASRRLEQGLEGDVLARAAIHFAIGRIQRNLHRLEEAEDHYRRAVAEYEGELGPEHALTLSARADLGYTRLLRGDREEAHAILEEVLPLQERDPESLGKPLCETLRYLGALAYEEGDLTAAERYFLEVLARDRERAPTDELPPEDVRASLFAIYAEEGRNEEAEELMRGYIADAEVRYGADHAVIGQCRANLASVYLAEGRLEDAEAELLRAREILGRRLDPSHPQLAMTRVQIGELRADQGRFEEARAELTAGLAVLESSVDEHSPELLAARSTLASLDLDTGRAADAEALYRELVRLSAEAGPGERTTHAELLENLGRAVREQGRGEEALELLSSAVQELRALGTHDADLARALRGVAGVHHDRGSWDEAERAYLEALELDRRAWGEGHRELSPIYNDLAELAYDRGDVEGAIPWMREVVAIDREHEPDGPVPRAVSEARLGQFLTETGRHDEAFPLLDSAYERLAEHAEPEDPLFVFVEYPLGRCLLELGDAETAVPLLEHALELLGGAGASVEPPFPAPALVAELLERARAETP